MPDLGRSDISAAISSAPESGVATSLRGGEPVRLGVRTNVILPVYSESGLIDSTFRAVEAFAKEHPEYTFTFVDDGSPDRTAKMIRALIATSASAGQIALHAYTPNRGKGAAVKAGIDLAQTPLVIFTDGDLAYSLDHLPKMVEALERHDVVIGSRGLVARSERNTTLLRRVMGWTFNKCARVILGLGYSDTQAGLKGFRTPAAKAIFARQRLGGFAFDVELVFLARRLGYSVGEIPAHVSEQHSYKVSKVHMLKDPIRMFGALLKVRLNAMLGRYGK